MTKKLEGVTLKLESAVSVEILEPDNNEINIGPLEHFSPLVQNECPIKEHTNRKLYAFSWNINKETLIGYINHNPLNLEFTDIYAKELVTKSIMSLKRGIYKSVSDKGRNDRI